MAGNIVLSTEELVRSFQETVAKCTIVNYNLEHLIADAVATVEHADDFETTLRHRCDRLYLSQVTEHDDDQSAKLLTTAWHRLVCGINMHIEDLNYRNVHGRFDYYYARMIGGDIAVTRYEE